MVETIPKYVAVVLKEMCDRVGADFEKMDFKKNGWFQDYTWTQEEENNFKEWMLEYLSKNTEARQEIMNIPSRDRRMLEKTVSMFILNYGWKLSDAI